jgi:hypothetical protein
MQLPFQGNLGKARKMYLKALRGYEKALGADDSRSRSLRDKLRALDAMTENGTLINVGGPANKVEKETSHRGVVETASKSKLHKLLTKLGLR